MAHAPPCRVRTRGDTGQAFSLPFSMPEYTRRWPHFHPDDAYLFLTGRLWGLLPGRRKAIFTRLPDARSQQPTANWTGAVPDPFGSRIPGSPTWFPEGSTARGANDGDLRDSRQLNQTLAHIEGNPISAGFGRIGPGRRALALVQCGMAD